MTRWRVSVFFVVHLVLLLLSGVAGAAGLANHDGRAPAVLATRDAPRVGVLHFAEPRLERAARPRAAGDDPTSRGPAAVSTSSVPAIRRPDFVLLAVSRAADRHDTDASGAPHLARGPPALR
jgi:hypothetical protein